MKNYYPILLFVLIYLFFLLNFPITTSSIEQIDATLTIVDDTIITNTPPSSPGEKSNNKLQDATNKSNKSKPEKKCNERWICTEWSECINGIQTIECYDYNECGTFDFKPPLERNCLYEVGEEEIKIENPEKIKGFDNLLPLFIVIVMLLYVIFKEYRKL